MSRIEHIPTDPPGEITLELRDGTVIVKRLLYGAQAGPGVPAERDRSVQIQVPVAQLWRLLIDNIESFRFEEITADEIRDGLDYARMHGWEA